VSHDFFELSPLTSFPPNPGYFLSSFQANLFADSDELAEPGTNIVRSKISVHPYNGFTGIVTFSVTGLPPGVTASFDPGETPNTSMLTLTVSPRTPAGISTVTIHSRSGELARFTTVSLTISNNGSKLGALVGGRP
jgi:hypothetical protein